jgi:type VII secretion protein EccB
MQSALVRRDAVMLNDPMRTHSRATAVGAILGVLGLVGFVIFGLISPQPTVPGSGSIVIGQESGTVYAVVGNPIKLIPTFNLASARLLLMAQSLGSQAAAGSQPANGQPAASPAPAAVVNATVVSDDQLRNIPRGRLSGIPDGPQLLPTASQRISNNWAVCDSIQLNTSTPDQTSPNKIETTVFAGVPTSGMGGELAPNDALLAKAANGKTYLIYRQPAKADQTGANTVRAEVDQDNPAVTTALSLNMTGRQISMALLNAIPEVAKLTPPQIPNVGGPPANSMNGLRVGDVFSISPAGSIEYWVVLQNGVQQVSAAVSDIIRAAKAGGQDTVTQLSLDRMVGVRKIEAGDPDFLPVDDFPQQVPNVRNPADQSQVSCLGWSLTGDPANPTPHTAVYVGDTLPGPKNSQAISVGQASPDGSRIDKFFMPSGFGAVVQSATGKDSFGKGPIELISDRGLRYGVPDINTAKGLGLDNMAPAPDSIISLLPTGASLNMQAALQTFDSVPIDPKAGTYPTAPPQPAG